MTTSPRTAIFPGTFDPVTRGHLDVAARAAELFDKLVIGVLENPSKTPLLTVAERVELLRSELSGLGGAVDVQAFSGLTVEFASTVGARWIVRGVRSATDVAHELPMALSNRVCGREPVETVLLATSPEFGFIASSLVRQIALGGGDLTAFVTPAVEAALRDRVAGR